MGHKSLAIDWNGSASLEGVRKTGFVRSVQHQTKSALHRRQRRPQWRAYPYFPQASVTGEDKGKIRAFSLCAAI